MTTFKRRKIRFYKNPYYPPGYSGYYSQLPFQFGETFGTTTNRLLKDSDVAKSDRSILVDLTPQKIPDEKRESDKEKWIRRRNKSWGDIKFNEQIVPGYSAYIPRSEEHFGARYAEICERSILDHNNNRLKYEKKLKDLVDSSRPPIKAIRREPAPYIPLNPILYAVSPYFMENTHPDKTFVSGYTGYIPKGRQRFSEGYPIATQRALKHFTREQNASKSLEDRPIQVQRPPYTYTDPDTCDRDNELYSCEGLIPNYTGYLPGDKFRYGLSYGASSRYFHSNKSFCIEKSPFVF